MLATTPTTHDTTVALPDVSVAALQDLVQRLLADVTADHDVLGRISKDFAAKDVAISDHQISRTMDELMAKAVNEIKAG